MKETIIFGLLVLFAFFSVDCFAGGSSSYIHKDHGYRVKMPANWKKVSDDVVKTKYSMHQGKKIFNWDAAFQADPNTDQLSYPHVYFQVTSYSDWGFDGQPSSSEIRKIVKDINKVNSHSKNPLDRIATDENEVTFDAEDKYILIPLEFDFKDAGKYKGMVKRYYGREGTIQVTFYDNADNWENSAQVRSDILNSIKINPSAGFDESLDDQPRPLRMFGVPILVGACCGLVYAVVRKRKTGSD